MPQRLEKVSTQPKILPLENGMYSVKEITGHYQDYRPGLRKIRSQGLSVSIPINRYESLDKELFRGLKGWIDSGVYKTNFLSMTQDLTKYTEWNERLIISRILKILKLPFFDSLPGRIKIVEEKDGEIKVLWHKNERVGRIG